MAGPKRILREVECLAVHGTSSLNKYVICDHCQLKLKTKKKLIAHLNACIAQRTCTQCNKVFKHRGTLFSHNYRIHGDGCQVSKTKKNFVCNVCSRSYKYEHLLRYHQLKVHNTEVEVKVQKRKQSTRHQCNACCKSYKFERTLRLHIRGTHFNFMSTDPEAFSRKINEVWYERVLNTDALMMIKKTGRNRYIFKKTPNTASVKICSPQKPIDITTLYPPRPKELRMFCYICERRLYMSLEVHIEKFHGKRHLAVYRKTLDSMEADLKKMTAATKTTSTQLNPATNPS